MLNGLFYFLSIQGGKRTSPGEGGIDPKFSREFLLKIIKKFPGGLKQNKRFPWPNNMGKFQGVQLQKFPATLI